MQWMIIVALMLAANSALALPGARPGSSCTKTIEEERSNGSIVEHRPDDDAYLVTDDNASPKKTVFYRCDQGRIVDQMLMLTFEAASQARQEFSSIRNELERELGKADFDGSNPRDLRELEESAKSIGGESADSVFRDFVMWGDWRLSLYQQGRENPKWIVGLSFRRPAA